MNTQPQETTHKHTRLMKCALEIEDCRAYWAHSNGTTPVSAQQAFDDYWFGARSLDRIKVLLVNMQAHLPHEFLQFAATHVVPVLMSRLPLLSITHASRTSPQRLMKSPRTTRPEASLRIAVYG